MASPVAGNESFSNVENLSAQVASLNVSQLNVNVLTSENEVVNDQSLLGNVKPSLEGLIVTDHTGQTAPNYVAGINVSDYTNAARTVQLPSATVGTVVVHLQAGEGIGTGALEFDCASGDAFDAGALLPSITAGALTYVAPTNDTNSNLDYNSGGVANTILGAGSMIYFWCTSAGTWHVHLDGARGAAVLNGQFTFS